LALLWWPWGPGPWGCCRGCGWGEAPGPGEKGPVLSRLFSRLCTLGLLLPTVGGVKKEGGRFRIFIGTESGRCFVFRPTSKSASSSLAESSRMWIVMFSVLCTFSSFPDAILISVKNLTLRRRAPVTGQAAALPPCPALSQPVPSLAPDLRTTHRLK
jgi:hypothetical protein